MPLPLHIRALTEKIWEACKQDRAKLDAAIAAAGINDGSERFWKRVYRLIKPPKIKGTITDEQYKRYRDAKYNYESREFIHWVKDGHFIEPDVPDVNTANGLTDYICNFLNWSGHFANRTNNMGVKRGEIYTKSSSIAGMQDIDNNIKHPAHPFGIPWKIEIKVGKDTHKQAQKDFGKKVNRTGGIYSVVRDVDDFFEQYDRLFQQKELF